MKSTNWQDIADLLPELDKLTALGWEPLLNKLNTCWHVNLSHKTAPTPMLTITNRGVISPPPHPYRIHGRGQTLRLALQQALEGVAAVTESVGV